MPSEIKGGALFPKIWTGPKTFLQCFALEHSLSKAKHCRSALGQVLRPNFLIQKDF